MDRQENKKEIKNHIQKLINENYLEEAKYLIEEYCKYDSRDAEIYSMLAVIHILNNKLNDAEIILKKGLNIKKDYFDLLYNLAYVYKEKGLKNESHVLYTLCQNMTDNLNMKNQISEIKKQFCAERNIYKVILYGDKCEIVKDIFEGWHIIGMYDNEDPNAPMYIGKDKLEECDFIFLTTEVNREEFIRRNKDILENKVVYFYDFFKTSVIEGVDNAMLNLFEKDKVEGIITGLSYGEVGIDAEKLPGSFVNLALSSQDLYYDLKLLKTVYELKNVKENLKNVIINLAYYSFDYDMTKTIAKYRIHRYLDYFEDYHNNTDIIGVEIASKFYKKNIKRNYYENMNHTKSNTIMSIGDVNQIYEAERNSSMNHIETRKENIKIFEEYLSFLEDRKINIYIVVCPVSEEYRKYFDVEGNRNKFYEIIDDLRSRHEFNVMDYFEDSCFSNEDFWDYSHLNKNGRNKLTEKMNKYMMI